MDHITLSKIVFVIILGFVLFLSYKIIAPYISFIVLAVILGFLFRPIYRALEKKIKQKTIASLIVVFLVLFIIIIPVLLMFAGLVVQASAAYRNISKLDALKEISAGISEKTGLGIDISAQINTAVLNLKNYIINSVPTIIGGIAHMLIGLFIMCFVMFYIYKEGDTLYAVIKEHFPLKKEYKEAMFREFDKVTKAVLYGQVITAIVQGSIAGLGFFIFGIPNPLFWGFIMVILAFLPFIGAPLVWVPASILEIAQGNYFSGVGLFIYGAVIVSNIDNIIKPKIISGKANIHPVVVMLGVIGGLQVFGFIGLFVGPRILEILIIRMKSYGNDFETELKQKNPVAKKPLNNKKNKKY
ncbi:MAG: AI-2E family transporter, partial [Candidatus Woesearchaeota archaeon]